MYDEVYTFDAGREDDPEPVDLDSERATLTRMFDVLRAAPGPVSWNILEECGQCTEWIVWQMGCLAEHFSQEEDHKFAYVMASASVQAATQTTMIHRLFANYLTLGNVLLRAGDSEDARSVYLQVLEIPFSAGDNERASAHIALAQMYEAAGDPTEAVYHFERGFAHLQANMPAKAVQNLLKTMVNSYAKVGDAAGIALCTHRLKLGSIDELLVTCVSEENSFDFILSFVTRLYSLQEPELADRAFTLWCNTSRKELA